MTMILSALPYGLLIGVLSIGVYISYKIMNIPDLTVDGSFAVGAVTNGILCLYGHPLLGLLVGLFFGGLAGMCTGLIHTQLKVNPILSGVLVQTGLISVNVLIPLSFGEITAKSTSFAINQRFGGDTIFMMVQRLFGVKNPDTVKVLSIIVLVLVIAVVIALLLLFFSTQLGLSIRATGNNEEMVKASSINTNLNKVIAFTLANGIVGFAGALYVQYMRSYSEGIGLGMLVTALASIIIGETLFGNHRLFAGFIIVVLGSLIYRVIYAFAIRNGGANGIKLFSSVIVILFIAFSVIRKKVAEKRAFDKAQEEANAGN
ncbi:MAG: hypothetical protein IJP62_01700 [Treponema sp.]|nr:hypothetical protein [Treponema sp.]